MILACSWDEYGLDLTASLLSDLDPSTSSKHEAFHCEAILHGTWFWISKMAKFLSSKTLRTSFYSIIGT